MGNKGAVRGGMHIHAERVGHRRNRCSGLCSAGGPRSASTNESPCETRSSNAREQVNATPIWFGFLFHLKHIGNEDVPLCPRYDPWEGGQDVIISFIEHRRRCNERMPRSSASRRFGGPWSLRQSPQHILTEEFATLVSMHRIH